MTAVPLRDARPLSNRRTAGKCAWVGISLTQFEQGAPFDGDYSAALAALQKRIARLQLAQIVHGRRVMILFEGWQGAGKKGALKVLAGALDPCHSAVHCVGGAELEGGRHWLAPYWSRLPRSGETAIFFPSWYSDAVNASARGELVDKAWARTCDEINEFEAQQTDHGTLIVKLFFHVTAQVQAKRLQERQDDPWVRALAGAGQSAAHDREAQLAAWTDMFKRSDTRWAKWTVIAAGNEKAARISALDAFAQALEKAVPAEPPLRSGNVVAIASAGGAGGAA